MPLLWKRHQEKLPCQCRSRRPSFNQSFEACWRVVFRFWQRALSLAKPGHSCIEHFVDGFEDYVYAVVQETNDKASGRLRTVQDYLKLRRGTTSSKSIFALIEFGLDLPDNVLSHPVVKRLTEGAADICAITNVSLIRLKKSYLYSRNDRTCIHMLLNMREASHSTTSSPVSSLSMGSTYKLRLIG